MQPLVLPRHPDPTPAMNARLNVSTPFRFDAKPSVDAATRIPVPTGLSVGASTLLRALIEHAIADSLSQSRLEFRIKIRPEDTQRFSASLQELATVKFAMPVEGGEMSIPAIADSALQGDVLQYEIGDLYAAHLFAVGAVDRDAPLVSDNRDALGVAFATADLPVVVSGLNAWRELAKVAFNHQVIEALGIRRTPVRAETYGLPQAEKLLDKLSRTHADHRASATCAIDLDDEEQALVTSGLRTLVDLRTNAHRRQAIEATSDGRLPSPLEVYELSAAERLLEQFSPPPAHSKDVTQGSPVNDMPHGTAARARVVTRSLSDRIEMSLRDRLATMPSPIEFVRIELAPPNELPGAPRVGLTLDPAAMTALHCFGNLHALRLDLSDAKSVDAMVSAIRTQTDLLDINYQHDECDTTWTDTHSCACDDECPNCGVSIQASNWRVMRALEESERPGIFSFNGEPESEHESGANEPATPRERG